MKTRTITLIMALSIVAGILAAACGAPVAQSTAAQSGASQSPAATIPQVAVTAAPSETAEPAPDVGKVPPGWKKYSNAKIGFSFYYPGDWEVYNETELGIQLVKPDPNPSGVGPLPIFYVAAIPPGESHSGLDFMIADAIRNYLALPVGESALTEPNAIPAEAFSYTRLPDTTVAGLTAAVIENQTVWEAPDEIVDRRALLETEAGLFSIGTYYITPADLEIYAQILETFELKP